MSRISRKEKSQRRKEIKGSNNAITESRKKRQAERRQEEEKKEEIIRSEAKGERTRKMKMKGRERKINDPACTHYSPSVSSKTALSSRDLG